MMMMMTTMITEHCYITSSLSYSLICDSFAASKIGWGTFATEEKYGLSGVRLAESLSDEEGAEGMVQWYGGRKKWTVGNILCRGESLRISEIHSSQKLCHF